MQNRTKIRRRPPCFLCHKINFTPHLMDIFTLPRIKGSESSIKKNSFMDLWCPSIRPKNSLSNQIGVLLVRKRYIAQYTSMRNIKLVVSSFQCKLYPSATKAIIATIIFWSFGAWGLDVVSQIMRKSLVEHVLPCNYQLLFKMGWNHPTPRGKKESVVDFIHTNSDINMVYPIYLLITENLLQLFDEYLLFHSLG